MDSHKENPELERTEERILDPSNLDAEHHALELRFEELLEQDDDSRIKDLALDLSPGDLSEILRPLGVGDTARILRLLPPDPLAEVLGEIDNRSLSVLFELLEVDEIADIIEEMPSDDAADVIGELDRDQAAEVLAAMEEEERSEVAELLQYAPETAGGLMGKEFTACTEGQTCGEAVSVLRGVDQEDLEETHFVYVVDGRGRLTGRLSIVRLLLSSPKTRISEVMEIDPLYVEVELDQEEVAGFFQMHDLISLPVVDHQLMLVGQITADDILDVMEEEATEDISRLAGVSIDEFGEHSSFRVARSRLPWLLGGMAGQMGAVFVMDFFKQSLESMVILSFYVPMILAMAGNVGIQTSSVVVRGLATGEVDYFHLGRHLFREIGTALITGLVVSLVITTISYGYNQMWELSAVLGLTMFLVILFAATVGTGIPLLLHRMGTDPAVATGPFITTANDIVGLWIYLGLASTLLGIWVAN